MNIDGGGFGDLLQQAEQMTAELDIGMDLPRVERNPRQILKECQTLLSQVAPVNKETMKVKASLVLGSQGYDVSKVSQRLDTLTAKKAFEPLEPVRDTDIEGFLKNERENALLTVIENARKNTLETCEQRLWGSMEEEWEREKQKMLNALLGTGHQMLDYSQETEQSLLSDAISMQGRSALNNVEMAYASQVYIYNKKVLEGGIRLSLQDLFMEAANSLGDKLVIDKLWSMVEFMVNVPMVTSSAGPPRQDKKLLQAFVGQARKYLEHMYVKYVTTMVYENLYKAKRGGKPGTYSLIRSFLNVKYPTPMRGEDGLLDGHPVWAVIYYCLRCGDLDAVQEVVNKSSQQLKDFPEIITEYMKNDRSLGPSTQTKVRHYYRRTIKNSSDPYKRAVYSVISQSDPLEAHAEIADKTEDYLWLKLCQIQFEVDPSGQDQYTLQKLQSLLYEEYGESHFNAYQQPYLYFQVLFLTCQFEAALEFLSRIDALRCHAVHVALVLFELKLLLLPSSTQVALLTQDPADPSPQRRLNFARLVMMYTRKFEATDPREALQYFFFLRNIKSSTEGNLFMSCVTELIFETKEFEMMLGKLNQDGIRLPGAIDKFQADSEDIIKLVAKSTQDKGFFEEAVKLYDLAHSHDQVMILLNKLLSDVVSQPNLPQSNRERLRALALDIAQRYQSLGHNATRDNTNTFFLMLDLMTFFDQYHSGNLSGALEVIGKLKVVPLEVDCVKDSITNFNYFSDEIRKCLPDILLATMQILNAIYRQTRKSFPQSPGPIKAMGSGQEASLNQLRSKAKALIMFVGMLPYRLPGDTNARLVQLEVQMN
ncbi:pore complex Nup93-like [Octopus vulgaris]|uniref:Pore complex Nup93-like n=2 Tax=Octopus TaxID=6643 RepID=A0AA36ARF5_OCTVU|nr:nuclear pore complex protein Nup93 [Octopus sinensis]CAI9720298.1 pore complex Nup93-like [Octopus vulgaris]